MKFIELEGHTRIAEDQEDYVLITQHTHLEGLDGRKIVIIDEVWKCNIPNSTLVTFYIDNKMEFEHYEEVD